MQDLSGWALERLVEACQREMDNFFRGYPSDSCYGMELFRRALVLHEVRAWDKVFLLYHRLVRGWLRQCSGFDTLDIPIEELELLSFERFWHAFYHKRSLSEFESLRALLHYLRLCCMSTITDELRQRSRDRALTQSLSNYPATEPPPTTQLDQQMMEQEESHHFWQTVEGNLRSQEEEVLVRSYFIHGLKPRQIHATYPRHFPAVQDVYRIKRNVLSRLSRMDGLREIWQG